MNTFETITSLLAIHAGVDESDVKIDSTFVGDLPLDSLDVYEFIMAVEEHFDFEIPDETIHRLPTVGDLVRYIDARLGAGKTAHA